MFPRPISGGFVSLFAYALASVSNPVLSAPSDPEPFTIADSIEMTLLNDPDSSMLKSNTIELSPDGRWFFLVTKKGNLKTGANDFTLWLYDAAAVRASIATPNLPSARAVAKFSSSSNRSGIAQPRWTSDSRSIAFLGEGIGEVPQLYMLDVLSGSLKRLTSHATPVVGFDIHPNVDSFIYVADAPVDTSEYRARGYEIGKTNMLDVMQGRSSFSRSAAFFIGNRKGGPGRPVKLDPQNYVGAGLWLSPHGRYAIFPRHIAKSDLSWWRDYDPVNRPPFDKANDPSIASFSTANPSVFLQYYIVDLSTGKTRALLDAPTGFLFGGIALGVHWAADEKSVILSNTFLPLQGVTDPQELARRKASPSVVELDLRTGMVNRIVDLLAPRGGQPAPPRPFGGSIQTRSGDVIVKWNTPIPASQVSTYRKGPQGWTEVDAQQALERSTAAISVTVTQGLNQPPELKATDIATGQGKTITDLNPQFKHVAMGKVEVLEGKDPDGRPWRAGLLKPVGYEPGKRYPLVIQTHGFDPNTFMLDGPFGSTSGYAARALASRGIMVLQLQDSPPPYGTPDEPVNAMRLVKAAIDTLNAAGLIDIKRIGIHGFSRTGLVVQEALVNSKIPFAAASIADANSRGVLNYLWGFGAGFPAMMDTEWLMGTPLWGDENARLWADRDPTFHLDRVHTPLKIDAYSAPAWFDAYAILRRHQKPVEYWAYPDSTHNPVKPWQRMTTQGGTVDWYDFWLNNHEDPDPAKADQYARWRQLRTLHEADLAAAGKGGR